MVAQIVEGTILLVLAFLVLSRADSFYTVASAIGGTYVGAVKALQGR